MSRRVLVVCLAGLLSAGCTWIEQADEQTIRISIGQLGLIAPGLRQVISWPEAEHHCHRFGKEAKLVDLNEKVAVWRCVADE